MRTSWNKGLKIGSPSSETRQRMSQSHKGFRHSDNTKMKLSFEKKNWRILCLRCL
jgi:hypothetical protein